MMRFFAPAIAMAMLPMGAGVSVWHYQLTNSSPITCDASVLFCDTGLTSNYEFLIDEAFYPGGSIAGSTLRLAPEPGTDFEHYSVTTGGNTFTGVLPQSNPADRYGWTNWFDFPTNGINSQSLGLDDLFQLFTAATFFEITFDANRQVSSWSYFGETGSSSGDYGGGTGRLEVIGGGYHAVETSWQVTPPSSVPLPAAGGLLGMALGALAWFRRRQAA